MREINIYNLQLMDFELFLNVAKYESFTKAGERMFMTQSRVSKRISIMEDELGLRLFIRNKRKVVLTPAGRILARRLRNISDDILSHSGSSCSPDRNERPAETGIFGMGNHRIHGQTGGIPEKQSADFH